MSDGSGYGRIAKRPQEDPLLTHVEFGTPMGELLRRYWQPVTIEMTTTPGEVDYLLEPERTMQLAEFLHSVGAISQMPGSWKDYYWENNYDLDGS